MTVSQKEIKEIKPGETKVFFCDPGKMYSVATALCTIKRRCMPEGVVDYEHKKVFDKGIIIIRAMREGDEPVLNKDKR